MIPPATIGVVDERAGRRAARRPCHLKRGHRKARLQVDVEGPPDHAPAEDIQHDGQEGARAVRCRRSSTSPSVIQHRFFDG
jgi:hypothetical protein